MVDRCQECRGRKQVMGLGGIPKDCANCLGVGYVSAVGNMDSSCETLVSKNVPVKRGRKRKVIDD